MHVIHFVSGLIKYTGDKGKRYERALKANGVVKVVPDKNCHWTVITVVKDSEADQLLQPLSMHQRESHDIPTSSNR